MLCVAAKEIVRVMDLGMLDLAGTGRSRDDKSHITSSQQCGDVDVMYGFQR